MSRDDPEIHNHSSLWHWWKLYWIKCIGILITNLWYSELPLGHQYLLQSYFTSCRMIVWLCMCRPREDILQSSQPAAERWSFLSTGRINTFKFQITSVSVHKLPRSYEEIFGDLGNGCLNIALHIVLCWMITVFGRKAFFLTPSMLC